MTMAKRLDGKVAVISGAAAGIGQASALRLAEEGAQLVLADREDAAKTLDLVTRAGGKAEALRCDVSDPTSVAALKRQVEQGVGRCDILVNNAGIYPMQNFDEITFEDWRRVLSVNLDSMFLMTKAFVGFMRERRWGRIINIASDTVSLVVPGFTHYIASKAGVIGFTRALATEFGELGITANAIAPGQTRTPGTESRKAVPGGMSQETFFEFIANMQAIKRVETVADLVGVVAFLASDDAVFVTGQTLFVNGGLVRS
jgi:NAD(P)-dependent dehydrogenase (short-subunit alcohol dehydrogenase family)